MTTPPRFSVLLPTYNRADILGFAIGSVLAQSEPDFELLIVADGCTDHTREVVSQFNDPRIRFFDLPKAPHFGYANRNIALREAKGRLIAYAAHDDLLLPDHLALMGQLIEGSEAVWGYSRPLWVTTDGLIIPFGTNLTLADELSDFLEHGNTIPSPCVVHTLSALEAAGFWPEDVPSAGDWVLWKKMLGMSSYRPAYLPLPTTLHFSADWRKSRFSNMKEVETLARLAEQASWWPVALRQPPGSGSEQATLWRAIENGTTAFVAELRASTETVVNKIAWLATRDLKPSLDAAVIAKEQAEAHTEERDQRLLTADQDLRRIMAEVEERDRRLVEAGQGLRRLTAAVEERDQQLAAADQDLRHLTAALEERDRRLVEADWDLRRLMAEVEERGRELVEADQGLRRLTAAVEERDRELRAANCKL
jgi:hypothetical protein